MRVFSLRAFQPLSLCTHPPLSQSERAYNPCAQSIHERSTIVSFVSIVCVIVRPERVRPRVLCVEGDAGRARHLKTYPPVIQPVPINEGRRELLLN